MITPEQVQQFIEHSPLRFGLLHCCKELEHSCTPETCDNECLKDAAEDLARWINEEGMNERTN